ASPTGHFTAVHGGRCQILGRLSRGGPSGRGEDSDSRSPPPGGQSMRRAFSAKDMPPSGETVPVELPDGRGKRLSTYGGPGPARWGRARRPRPQPALAGLQTIFNVSGNFDRPGPCPKTFFAAGPSGTPKGLNINVVSCNEIPDAATPRAAASRERANRRE